MRISHRLALLGAGVVVTATAGGCGGSSSSSASSPSGQVTKTVTATPTPSGSTSASATPSATTKPAIARCTLADLHITLSGKDGAMGSVYTNVVITNTSPAACATGGYGGVALVDAAHHPIGAPAKRDTSKNPLRIVLQPGHRAKAQLQVGEAGNYDAADCDPKPAVGLQIIPPNETHAVVVPYDATGCAKSGVVLMSLQPYRAG